VLAKVYKNLSIVQVTHHRTMERHLPYMSLVRLKDHIYRITCHPTHMNAPRLSCS